MTTTSISGFIDAHCHTHSLQYDAWEILGMTGSAAMVLSCGNPHIYQEVYEEVPDWDVMKRYWEMPIRSAPEFEKMHMIKVFVAVGISFMTPWRGWEKAIEELPRYLRMPRVVAVGETGIDPWQYWGWKWPIEEGKIAFREQVKVAKELDVPIMLHTPTQREGFLPGVAKVDFKRHFLDMDMDIINKIGFDHKRLLVDHADETIIEHVLKETDAFIGVGVGIPLRHTNPSFFADVVQQYGPERLIIDSDYAAEISCDLFAIPKTIRELRRRGVDERTIHRVVFENANQFYRLGL